MAPLRDSALSLQWSKSLGGENLEFQELRCVSSWNLPPPVPWDENAIHSLLFCLLRVPRKTAPRPCPLLRSGPLREDCGPRPDAGSPAYQLFPPGLSAPSFSLHWPYCLSVTRGQPRSGLLGSGGGGPARAAGGQGASLSSSTHPSLLRSQPVPTPRWGHWVSP